DYVLTDGKLHADDTPVPVLLPGNKKTKTGRLWTYVRDDRNAGFNELYRDGRITEAACWAHARRKIHDVHVRTPSALTEEAL
ncbi:transposase, partial [Escherichia coli]